MEEINYEISKSVEKVQRDQRRTLVCINNVSILHKFLDTSTLTVYVTASVTLKSLLFSTDCWGKTPQMLSNYVHTYHT